MKKAKGHIKKENNMPLTKQGKKILAQMRKQYGKEKGKEVFYASINAKKKGSEKWHMGKSSQNFSHKTLLSALSKT